MTTDKFKFICSSKEQNKQEESISIILQNYINGSRKQLSTGMHIEVCHWDKKPSNLRSQSCNLYNSQLDKIKSKVNSIYMILRLQEIPFLLRIFMTNT
jgi:hypothetical protein